MLAKLVFGLVCCANIFAHKIIDLRANDGSFVDSQVAYNARMNGGRYGNPEERGPYFEGDMLMPLGGRSGMKSEAYRWARGEIPYEISEAFSRLKI